MPKCVLTGIYIAFMLHKCGANFSSIGLLFTFVDVESFPGEVAIFSSSSLFGHSQVLMDHYSRAVSSWRDSNVWEEADIKNVLNTTAGSAGPLAVLIVFNSWDMAPVVFQKVQSLYDESGTLGREQIVAFLVCKLEDHTLQTERFSQWSQKLGLETQVYILLWDRFLKGQLGMNFIFEVYSVKTRGFVQLVESCGLDEPCRKTNVRNIIEKKGRRRSNFHQVSITGVGINDPKHTLSTKFKFNNDTKEYEFESGVNVWEVWLLRDVLNFSEKALPWPNYINKAENGSLVGMAIPINANAADICLGWHAMVEYRAAAPNGITFLHSSKFSRIQVFFEQPASSSVRDILILAFSTSIWIVLGAVWFLLLVSLMAVKMVTNKTSQESKLEDASWIWILAALSQKAWYNSSASLTVQIVLLVALFTGLLVYSAYSSALAALLAVEIVPVKHFQNLIGYDFNFYADPTIQVAKLIVANLKTQRIMTGNSSNPEQEFVSVLKRLGPLKTAAVTSPDFFYEFLAVKKFDQSYVCGKLSNIEYGHLPYLTSMIVKRGSALREYFNCKITLMRERGALYRLHTSYRDQVFIRCSLVHQQASVQQGFKDLRSAFLILGVGTLLAFILYFVERAWTPFKRQ